MVRFVSSVHSTRADADDRSESQERSTLRHDLQERLRHHHGERRTPRLLHHLRRGLPLQLVRLLSPISDPSNSSAFSAQPLHLAHKDA